MRKLPCKLEQRQGEATCLPELGSKNPRVLRKSARKRMIIIKTTTKYY